jgi:indole-3-glycerol phosphate synthase
MPTTLERILASTRAGLPDLKSRRAELERAAASTLAPPSFRSAMARTTVALIAEVKRKSPSAGEIQAALDPVQHAEEYARAGAAAISVLTEGPNFGGSVADLRAVARRGRLPVLRKDFILDEAQILEARAAGASAILLIVRALTPERLVTLREFAEGLKLDALVEVHDQREQDMALDSGARIIGVNSRNLDTLAIDVPAAWALLGRIPPDRIAIAESGMANLTDVEQAAAAGADGVLIGTALSRALEPYTLAASLAGVSRRGR